MNSICGCFSSATPNNKSKFKNPPTQQSRQTLLSRYPLSSCNISKRLITESGDLKEDGERRTTAEEASVNNIET
jgi:hypothetical protein